MQIRNITGFIVIVLVSLSFFVNCSSGDEPVPVDCSTSSLKLAFTSTDPTSCGTNDGAITATATGGDQPYQFALDAQAYSSTSSFNGLGPGTYQVKLKDKNGCERNTTVTLKPFGSSLAATVQVVNSGCKTNKGDLTINATGGTGPYSYKLNGGTASPTNIFGSLTAGSYSVMVTDNTGCSTTQTVKVLSGTKYSTDVKSIIDTNCAISGCHVSGGSGTGNFTVFANVQASASQIKASTQGTNPSMPKTGSLTKTQIDAIACWVDDGALDN